jgi:hypothetical protein
LEVSGVATDTFLTPIVSVTEVTDDSFRKIFAAMSQMTLFAKSSHQRHKCASHLDLVSNRSNGVFEVFVFCFVQQHRDVCRDPPRLIPRTAFHQTVRQMRAPSLNRKSTSDNRVHLPFYFLVRDAV